MRSLPVLNLHEAKFECTFGRGCEGVCCRNGRPPVYPDDEENLALNLHKFLPHLRPEALQAIEEKGHLSNRRKCGVPMLRVVDGWCIFFNQGCVLHKVGVAEGDKYRYKPAPCALFPLERDDEGRWFVRQKGFKGEPWELPCLEPQANTPPAALTIQDELELAERHAREQSVTV